MSSAIAVSASGDDSEFDAGLGSPLGAESEAAYRTHGARCYSLAFRLLGEQQPARDVVLNAFAQWYQERERTATRSPSLTWLLAVTHRAAVDVLRERACHGVEDMSGEQLWDEAASAEPREPLEERQRVRRALRGLTAHEQDVVVMAYFGGHSQAAIAAHLDLPLGAVKASMGTGMLALQKALAGP